MMLSISLISANSYAQAPIVAASGRDVVLIDKGTEAPFKGYLFPEDKALKFRKDLIELDTLRGLEESYQKSLDLSLKNEDLYNYKVNTLLEQNDKLSDQLYKSKDRDVWENRIWFAFGVIVTAGGAWVFSKTR